MKANQGIERVYELVEQFEFDELTEQDKTHVLSLISENEYVKMRVTFKDTVRFFTNTEELTLSDDLYKSLLTRKKEIRTLPALLRKPVQIYKVAAAVLVILGIYAIIRVSYIRRPETKITLNDTIYIHKTDTVYEKLVDTVRIIKEKIVYISDKKDHLKQARLISTSNNVLDPGKEICPEDVDKITALAFNSNISRDTLYRD